MVKRTTKKQEEFSGDVTPKMLALWAMASLPQSYELKMQVATLQFYFKSSVTDGLRVRGTQSLAVTEKIANMYFGED